MSVWTIKERNSLVRSNEIASISDGGGTRCFFAGGATPSQASTIDFVTPSSTGNATDFGDLTVARHAAGAGGSKTRGAVGGGSTGSISNVIDYFNFASAGNASDFGNLSVTRTGVAACGNEIKLVCGGGDAADGTYYNVLDEIHYATTANAIDFGNLQAVESFMGASGSTTRGVWFGGNEGTNAEATAHYITFATRGNATDFGEMTTAKNQCTAAGNNIKCIITNGQTTLSNGSYEETEIATTGNYTDYDDLTVGRYFEQGASSTTRALFGGGTEASPVGKSNIIDFTDITSSGNFADFGNLTVSRHAVGAIGNGGGGIGGAQIQRPELFALNRPGQTIGMFGGGYDGSSYISSCEVIQVETLGRSSDYGDLTQNVSNSFSMSGNRTRGVRHKGYVGGSSPYTTNTMDYTEFATRGNFADFGNATAAGYGASRGPSTNDTRSFSMGLYNASGNLTIVDYWAPSTLGNAADFGDLTAGRTKAVGMANTTRVICYGSYGVNTIDYHAIASLGDFSDFGDAVAALGAGEAVSSPVRGVRCGAQSASNTMEYITMASTGNGTDFGDLTVGRNDLSAASSHTRGVLMGGVVAGDSLTNTMDYITIASAGNATDFGDLSFARGEGAGMSNGHGGLAP